MIMRSNSILILLSFVILPIVHSSSCTPECGGIQIPFPFGIGKNCSFNEWYEIECRTNNISGKEFPFLANISMEVVNISLQANYDGSTSYRSYSSVSVKSPITAMGCCSSNGDKLETALNLTGTPFFFGDGNSLVAVGCNNKAAPTNIEPKMVGCESSCATSNNSQSIPFFDKVGCSGSPFSAKSILPTDYIPVCNTTKQNDTICNGNGCCQAKAPAYIENCICDNSTIYGIIVHVLEVSGVIPYLFDNCADINECVENEKLCDYYFTTCKNVPGGHRCVSTHKFETLTGIVVGFSVLILVGGIWWLRKFLKRRRMTKRKRRFFKRNGGLLLEQQLHTTQGNVEKTKIFTSRELEKATDNFHINRVVGQGGQGTVYKGMLVDGQSVAFKKSIVVDEDKLQEFINEVIILSQINHRHVVKLLGWCLETEVPVLVYEFITNGNLFQHLHEEFDDYTVLWGVRMRIAVDIAGALSYLHSAASSPIYHRDIKSTNILLDEKYRARVSDFGTSRSVTIDHSHWTTVISGTVGYVDPEYYGSSHFTEKSDVYSFGVVLAELITGEKPVITLSDTQEITGLADYFRLAMKENRLFEIIDARIRNDCKLEQVIAVANLAIRCLKKTGKNRPDMREVSTDLERIYSSPEEFQVQIQIDGEDKLYRGGSCSSVTGRTTM